MKYLARISAAVVLAAACGRGVSSPMAATDISGVWTKVERDLPPVQLEITRSGDRLAARLSLSGVVAEGTARLDGDRVTLELQGPLARIDGRIVSKDKMQLTLGADIAPQRLERSGPNVH